MKNISLRSKDTPALIHNATYTQRASKTLCACTYARVRHELHQGSQLSTLHTNMHFYNVIMYTRVYSTHIYIGPTVAGQRAWNGLPVELHLTPMGNSALFFSDFKIIPFEGGWAGSTPYGVY